MLPYRTMPKPSHREILLTAGLRLVHEKGFSRASVRDIVTAAGVPQGSFTNHFRTKEQFGLAVLERYYGYIQELMERTLLNEKRQPLERIRSYVFRERRKRESWRAFSCPRSKEPHCFARLTAVSSPCGGSSGFFSARSSRRMRNASSRGSLLANARLVDTAEIDRRPSSHRVGRY